MATAKKKPAKAVHAPYGLKKDGTPKKKPGVKAGPKAPAARVRLRADAPAIFSRAISLDESAERAGVAVARALNRDEPIKPVSEVAAEIGYIGNTLMDIEQNLAELHGALMPVTKGASVAADPPSEDAPLSPLAKDLQALRQRLSRVNESIRAAIGGLAV